MGTLLPPSVRGRGSGETQGQTMTCSNPECHTDTPGWHKGRGLTHTGPAVLAGHVGVNALTLEATLGVLAARGCVAGGVHFVFTLVDVCTHDGRSVASPLAPPQEATPPRACPFPESHQACDPPLGLGQAPGTGPWRLRPRRPLGLAQMQRRPSWETVAPRVSPPQATASSPTVHTGSTAEEMLAVQWEPSPAPRA